MEKLYIALVDTPGFFANLIRRVIGINYIHVVLSMNAELTEAYSVGRRNPFVPFFAGFEKEELHKIHMAFPTARYRIYSLACTKEQKEAVRRKLALYYQNRFHYHYCIIGLFFLLANKPFYQKRHYTCSSFTARILEESNVLSFGKHFSLVTPRDFYEYEKQCLIYEGTLTALCQSQETAYRLSPQAIPF